MKHVDCASLTPPAPPSVKTRNTASEPCKCSLCEVGRLSGFSYTSFKEAVAEPVGRPRVNPPPPEAEALRLCSLCHGPWGRGQEHSCTRESRRENVEEVVRQSSRRSKEKVLTSQLKEVFQEQGVSTRGGHCYPGHRRDTPHSNSGKD